MATLFLSRTWPTERLDRCVGERNETSRKREQNFVNQIIVLICRDMKFLSNDCAVHLCECWLRCWCELIESRSFSVEWIAVWDWRPPLCTCVIESWYYNSVDGWINRKNASDKMRRSRRRVSYSIRITVIMFSNVCFRNILWVSLTSFLNWNILICAVPSLVAAGR